MYKQVCIEETLKKAGFLPECQLSRAEIQYLRERGYKRAHGYIWA